MANTHDDAPGASRRVCVLVGLFMAAGSIFGGFSLNDAARSVRSRAEPVPECTLSIRQFLDEPPMLRTVAVNGLRFAPGEVANPRLRDDVKEVRLVPADLQEGDAAVEVGFSAFVHVHNEEAFRVLREQTSVVGHTVSRDVFEADNTDDRIRELFNSAFNPYAEPVLVINVGGPSILTDTSVLKGAFLLVSGFLVAVLMFWIAIKTPSARDQQ